MNGGLTYRDLDSMKRKAKVLDVLRDYLVQANPDIAIVRELVASGYQNESGAVFSGEATENPMSPTLSAS